LHLHHHYDLWYHTNLNKKEENYIFRTTAREQQQDDTVRHLVLLCLSLQFSIMGFSVATSASMKRSLKSWSGAATYMSLMYIFMSVLISSAPDVFGFQRFPRNASHGNDGHFGLNNIQRIRHPVPLPGYMHRAYWMKERTFWLLHDTLSPYLTTRHSAKNWRRGCPNGVIPSSSHLSITLRYFA
jgi:hypothetical protein